MTDTLNNWTQAGLTLLQSSAIYQYRLYIVFGIAFVLGAVIF